MISAEIEMFCTSRFSFGSSSGPRLRPADYARCLIRDLDALDAMRRKQDAGEDVDDVIRSKVSDDVGRSLDAIQAWFDETGAGRAEPSTSDEVRNLLTALLSADVLVRLVSNLRLLDFEVKKAVTKAFSWCMQLQSADGWPAKQVIEHITADKRLLEILVKGCLEPPAHQQFKYTLHFNVLLKACMRHSSIVEVLLREGFLSQIMGGLDSSSFEVTSEAFAILTEILFDNRDVSAPYVDEHFEEFFGQYNALLRKHDYVTVRRLLKLLGDLLFEAEYQKVMIRYVSKVEFLQLQMTLLRDKSKSIQFEAFNIFKIFVANPRKTPKVHQILYQNRDKLLKLLQKLSWTTREEDEVFLQDRHTTIEKLKVLEALGS
jgi:calcium binding protein 39